MSFQVPVYFGDQSLVILNNYLKENQHDISKIFILMDENTLDNCWSEFVSELPQLNEYHLMVVEPGEGSKCLEVLSHLYAELLENNADRKSILINLGGGMVSDLGGFLAATYMRGIAYINVPTSLLAMVDASIGGKTGIDFQDNKNIIGSFYPPVFICIYPDFLSTLPEREYLSAMAEIMKYALMYDADMWSQIIKDNLLNHKEDMVIHWIERCVALKNKIIHEDPYEKNERKKLNFGHTLGHAIESYYISKNLPMLHGEAIAWGMVAECIYAEKTLGCTSLTLEQIIQKAYEICPNPISELETIKDIIEFVRYDKKNFRGEVRLAIPEAVGKGLIDQKLSLNEASELLEKVFYLK